MVTTCFAFWDGRSPEWTAKMPQPADVTIAMLDVAGIDEAPTGLAATDPTVALDYPACDYTTCTIFTISEYTQAGHVYTTVGIFTDQGSQHIKEHPDGRP